MTSTFHLIDLRSQAHAVRELLRGKSPEEKIEWLMSQGTLELKPTCVEGEHRTFFFTSRAGRECAFFFVGDEIAIVGDHTVLRDTP